MMITVSLITQCISTTHVKTQSCITCCTLCGTGETSLTINLTFLGEGDHEQSAGGIAPNQVIARSEFEVHRHIYTE